MRAYVRLSQLYVQLLHVLAPRSIGWSNALPWLVLTMYNVQLNHQWCSSCFVLYYCMMCNWSVYLHRHWSTYLRRHWSAYLHRHWSAYLHRYWSTYLHRHWSAYLHRHWSAYLRRHWSAYLHRHWSAYLHRHSKALLHHIYFWCALPKYSFAIQVSSQHVLFMDCYWNCPEVNSIHPAYHKSETISSPGLVLGSPDLFLGSPGLFLGSPDLFLGSPGLLQGSVSCTNK